MAAGCDDSHPKENALRVLSLLDLTSLNDNDTEADIQSLIEALDGVEGAPASFCTWPHLAVAARSLLDSRDLKEVSITTVANFPSGSGDIVRAEEDIAHAVSMGADEIDVVFPWSDLMSGRQRLCEQLVERCRSVAGARLLKVILETGCLGDPVMIRRAAEVSIESGANFLKTSTGKTAVHATLEASDVLLCAIRDRKKSVGFKPSGGIRTLADADTYLKKAEDIMGYDWISSKTFRFGASSLLNDIKRVLSDQREELFLGVGSYQPMSDKGR